MLKGQTGHRDGIQDVLCPFPYLGITQYSRTGSHLGTSALDIGWHIDRHEPYFAPVDLKCVWIYPEFGQSMWQSINKVRLANGNIDYVTFVIAHDNSLDAYVGQVIRQGEQWGNKGDKGATGSYHCHIECGLGLYDFHNWSQNEYGIWCMPNEIDLDSVFFCDGTEVPGDVSGDWKYLRDVPVNENKQVNNYVINAYGDKIEVGNKVAVRANYQYGGKYTFVVNYDKYDVIEVNGARVVIGIGNTVTTAIHCDNLQSC